MRGDACKIAKTLGKNRLFRVMEIWLDGELHGLGTVCDVGHDVYGRVSQHVDQTLSHDFIVVSNQELDGSSAIMPVRSFSYYCLDRCG